MTYVKLRCAAYLFFKTRFTLNTYNILHMDNNLKDKIKTKKY